ncbi:hypothetical protein QTP88_002544 [Uroleucon formosanum]
MAVTKRCRGTVHIVIIQSSTDYTVLLSDGCAAALEGLTLIAVIWSERKWRPIGEGGVISSYGEITTNCSNQNLKVYEGDNHGIWVQEKSVRGEIRSTLGHCYRLFTTSVTCAANSRCGPDDLVQIDIGYQQNGDHLLQEVDDARRQFTLFPA